MDWTKAPRACRESQTGRGEGTFRDQSPSPTLLEQVLPDQVAQERARAGFEAVVCAGASPVCEARG